MHFTIFKYIIYIVCIYIIERQIENRKRNRDREAETENKKETEKKCGLSFA